MTAIPISIGESWSLASIDVVKIGGCDNNLKDEDEEYRPVYKIRLFIHGHPSEKPLKDEIKAVGLEREDALISRDLSNNRNIHLYGKGKACFEIEF